MQVAPVPDLPITDLSGAPDIALWSAEPGGQVRVSVWRSGSVQDLLVVPLLNPDPMYLDHVRVSVSPSGLYVAVLEHPAEPTGTRSLIRIFSMTGDLVWAGPPDVRASATTRWSPDGSRFAVDAGGRWIVVSPSGTGPANAIEIDARRPRLAVNQVAYPWALLDFSEDGSTLYGAVVLGVDRFSRPLARASASGGQIEPLASFPTDAGRRLAFPSRQSEALAEPVIDPATGRTAATGPRQSDGTIDIEVRGDGTVRHSGPSQRFHNISSLAWQNGSIVILQDDDSGGTPVQRLGVVETGKDLGLERVVASFDVVGQPANLIAVGADFSLLGFGRGLPGVPGRLFLIRMSDGAGTAIDPDRDPSTVESYGFAGWLPAETTHGF